MLHIDAEGYDYNILKSINFAKIGPEMILFEHRHLSGEDYRKAKELLAENNYSLFEKEFDTFAYRRLSLQNGLKLFFTLLAYIVK